MTDRPSREQEAPADEAPVCRCGGPTSRNPHPQAGDPSLEFGYVWQCIPCLLRSRRGWSERAHAAENALAAALAKGQEAPALRAALAEIRTLMQTAWLGDEERTTKVLSVISRALAAEAGSALPYQRSKHIDWSHLMPAAEAGSASEGAATKGPTDALSLDRYEIVNGHYRDGTPISRAASPTVGSIGDGAEPGSPEPNGELLYEGPIEGLGKPLASAIAAELEEGSAPLVLPEPNSPEHLAAIDSPITEICKGCRQVLWCAPAKQCLRERVRKSEAFLAAPLAPKQPGEPQR